jgi:hypothetical protein
VERENAFFKSSPVDEFHLPQINSEKVFFLGVPRILKFLVLKVPFIQIPTQNEKIKVLLSEFHIEQILSFITFVE